MGLIILLLPRMPACEEGGGGGFSRKPSVLVNSRTMLLSIDCMHGNASSLAMDRCLSLRREYDFILMSQK